MLGIDSTSADLITGVGAVRHYTNRDPVTDIYEAPGQVTSALKRTSTGWTETQPGGMNFHYDFNPSGWTGLDLAGWLEFELADWDNFALNGTPAGVVGKLTSIDSIGAQSWTITYGNQLISNLIDPAGGRTTFAYDASGKIKSVMDSASDSPGRQWVARTRRQILRRPVETTTSTYGADYFSTSPNPKLHLC